ncbi:MAG: MlaD family protein [Deltaproteobacteria bacterium]|nr:MlaD family protein [Deltaproteobacteria bacterium]
MEEGFTRKEKMVGLFLLVMIILIKITLLVIAQGKGWFQSQTTYYVYFKQGYNLRQGSLVKMFNTEIGKVTSIDFKRKEDENQVEVTIRVVTEKAGLIRTDSVAEVIAPTLIGSEYIEISPGSSGYPVVRAAGTIASQAHKTMSENLAELFNEETIKQARLTINNITLLTERLKNHEKAWLATVNHIDEVVVSVIKAQGTLGELVSRRDFYNRMNLSMTEVDKAILNVQKVTGDLVPAAQNLQTASKTIQLETETVKGILADIKGGTQEFPGLMETASETTQEGKTVVEAVKTNPLIRLTLPQEKKSQPLHVEPRHVP